LVDKPMAEVVATNVLAQYVTLFPEKKDVAKSFEVSAESNVRIIYK